MKTWYNKSGKRRKNQAENWFSFTNASGDSVDLSIRDEIASWGSNSARNFEAQMKALSKGTTINLRISSPGGDVIEGEEIYNLLSAHDGTVNITCGALCASIATIIAMAGDKVTIVDNGLFMIHNPWTFTGGEAKDLRNMAGVLDKMKENLIKAYAKRTGMTEKRLADLMDDETWMTSTEAKTYGFVDAILDEQDEEDVVENYQLTQFKNAIRPISLIKASKGGTPDEPERGNANPAPANHQEPAKPVQPTNNALEDYMKGKISIFNSLRPIALMQPDNGGGSGGGGGSATLDQEAVNKAARELYQAKLKRDEEIDLLVAEARTRDGRDYSALAAKAKKDDKTPEQFAMIMARAKPEEYKPVEADDSVHIQVTEESHQLENTPRNKRSGNRIITPGEAFTASASYKDLAARLKNGSRMGAHAVAETSGWAHLNPNFRNAQITSGDLTSEMWLPGIQTLGLRRLTIKDLIAPGTTINTAIKYLQELAWTGAAGMVAEGALKPEVTFAFEEVMTAVKKIAVWTKVTDELIQDFSAIASLINARLPYMIQLKEEDQMLFGDGVGENLLGILMTPGIQTRPVAADTLLDATHKAITDIREEALFEPDGFVFNPLDWQRIVLSKDDNGQYFGKGPFARGPYGTGQINYDTLWEKPVVVTPAMPEGTAACGAWRLGAQYFQRSGIQIESTNTNEDDFIKNRQTIRAEERIALATYRPAAFVKLTGLAD